MRYIISDIHGCKKQYLELLEKINFSALLGNHDYNFLTFIKELGLNLSNFKNEGMRWAFKYWQHDGGLPTVDGFLELTEYERQEIYDFLENAKVYEELIYKEKRYILSHAGIMNFQKEKTLEEYSKSDFIDGRMDYDNRYFKDENVVLVSGHTPTFYIRKDRKPIVFQENGHIVMDCGCVYGGESGSLLY